MSRLLVLKSFVVLTVLACLQTPAVRADIGLLSRPTWVDEPIMRATVLGPDQIPHQLRGVWRIGLCVKEGITKGHCWIRYENVHTGEVHTVGRFQKGIRGVRDRRTREWLYPDIEVSGLYWDFDVRHELDVRQGKYLLSTVVARDPRIFRENTHGHGTVRNNCVTYARDAWRYYAGREYELSLLHLPNKLRDEAVADRSLETPQHPANSYSANSYPANSYSASPQPVPPHAAPRHPDSSHRRPVFTGSPTQSPPTQTPLHQVRFDRPSPVVPRGGFPVNNRRVVPPPGSGQLGSFSP